jgi:hypothetical protein
MQVGDEGRSPSWALKVDRHLNCWLPADTMCYRSAIGGGQIHIARRDNGFHVYVPPGYGITPNEVDLKKEWVPVAEIHDWAGRIPVDGPEPPPERI